MLYLNFYFQHSNYYDEVENCLNSLFYIKIKILIVKYIINIKSLYNNYIIILKLK